MTSDAIAKDRSHGDYQIPNDIDNFLSKELLQLSMKARNAIDEEIHGVLNLAPEENPHFIGTTLLSLSLEIDRIPDSDQTKAAYLASQRYQKTYVNTSDFRLRFLRCELFDVKKAAIRMLKFLSVASELYGPKALQRPIRYSDFTSEEEKHYRMGFVQPLPYRDRAGRPIIVWVGDFGCEVGTIISRAKILFYIMYSVSCDIENQRKGIVMVAWIGNNEMQKIPKLDTAFYNKQLFEGNPIRDCSLHICLPDKPVFQFFRSLFTMVIAPSSRSRLKFHIGEETEMRYNVQCYGIPVELIPVTGTGKIKTPYLKQWIRLRKKVEDMKAVGIEDLAMIVLPRSNDVIFRTGTSLTCHPGNSMFQSIIESKMDEHLSASQVRKTAITKEIIHEVRQKGGTFLKWNTNGWWETLEGETQIHTRVAVSVRDFKSKAIARQNVQSSQSSTFLFRNQDGKRRKLAHDSGGSDDSDGGRIDACCFITSYRTKSTQ